MKALTFLLSLLLAPLRVTADILNHGLGGVFGMGLITALGEGDTTEGGTLGLADMPQGLFGESILQPTQPTQAAPSYALGTSCVAVYSTVQSPASVAADTVAEQDLTVTGLLAGSVVFVNKPTTQAGLGVCGARVKSANTLAIAFLNSSDAAITPTATEAYRVVEFRGPLIQTAALTFGATEVPAASTLEFEFDLTPTAGVAGVTSAHVANAPNPPQFSQGSSVSPSTTRESTPLSAWQDPTANLVLGGVPMTVVLNKPTTNAGIGICGVRVTGNNSIAIRFANPTAAGVNPTDETYSFVAINGLSLHGSIVCYTFKTGTVTTVATITTAERDFTINGLAVTDRVVGNISKPTLNAGVAPCSARVKSANTLAVTYVNPTAGSVQPSDEVCSVYIDKSATNPPPILEQFTTVLQPTAVATDTTAEQTFTVAGLDSGAPVCINVAEGAGWDADLGEALGLGLGIVGCRVSGANTLALTFLNLTAAAKTPGSLQLTILQAPVDTAGGLAGAGVFYPYDMKAEMDSLLLRAMREALVKEGAMLGS